MSKLWKWATKPTLSFLQFMVILIAITLLNMLRPWWVQDAIAFGFLALMLIAWAVSPTRRSRHQRNGEA